MQFIEIKKYLKIKGIDSLVKISKKDIEDNFINVKGVPLDYLKFINEIGVGNVDNRIDIKGYLFNFEDIGLDGLYSVPENIQFFGDNFSGDFIGFDLLKDDEVIEFWHESQKIYYTSKSFKEYITDLIII